MKHVEIEKHEQYNHKAVLNSMIKMNGGKMRSCKTKAQYKVEFTNVYNYERAAKYRINFFNDIDLKNNAGVK